MKKLFLVAFICATFIETKAQNMGTISGSLQYNQNFYRRDSLIGAKGGMYDKQLSGGEGWLNLNYSNSEYGLSSQVRLDIFNNSILHNPNSPTPENFQGLGFWNISKDFGNLNITGGYFYDQFGSGIVFRAYEDRGLGIDNAMYGVELKAKLFNDKLYIKAFTGRQKNLLTTFEPVLKGLNAESFFDVKGKVQFTPGISIVNRTLDIDNFNKVVAEINNMPLYSTRFIPKYNTYAYSIYNTANYGNFNWYAEYAGKTSEAIRDYNGNLINKAGSIIFTTLNYSIKGFGITGQYKRTDYFKLRIDPNENEVLLQGMVSFQPPIAHQNSLRLLARYQPATQELGEQAAEGDVYWSPTKGYKASANYTHIDDNHGGFLYQEIYADLEIKKIAKTAIDLGLQSVDYNLKAYRNDKGNVHAIVPFAELTYKISDKQSIRTELQYMFAKEDYGSFAYGLVEFNIAPHYSFAVSDMYNTVVNPDNPHPQVHYYNFFAAYTHHSTRFTASYVKQLAGIVCTGGVCRQEPAFSGVKMGISTTF